jgi:ELWxxDGT repeat protein
VANDGVHGRELWRSDGTPERTQLVADIVPGAVGSLPQGLARAGRELMFSASDGIHGPELWRSDGRGAGTVPVGEVRPGAAGSSPGGFAVSGNRLFWSAEDGVTGRELWALTLPDPATHFFALAPCRAADTRTTASPLAANTTRVFPVGGRCGVPADARAVAAIVVAVNPGEAGNLRVYPTGQVAPRSSVINFRAGRTRANNGTLTLGRGGQIMVQGDMPAGSSASTHFVMDVFGYYR